MKLIDQATVDRVVRPEEMVSVVRKAFRIYGAKKFFMPERYGVEQADMTFLYMPCFTETACGTKILSLVPRNRQRGLPSIDGVMILNNAETGTVEALLDAKSITSWRTGATGALAVQELSAPDASTMGIVGCGVQGFSQGVCICAARQIKQIRLFDPFKPVSALEKYAQNLRDSAQGHPDVVICASARDLLQSADIVVTTTFSTEPVLPDEPELLRGKSYIAVGSYKPYMKELPDALFSVTKDVYVDLPYACEESGDLSTRIESGLLAERDVKCLHQVLDDPAQRPRTDTVVFKTVGMALIDLAAAEYVLRRANEDGLGMEVAF